jgi:hypothetical protein
MENNMGVLQNTLNTMWCINATCRHAMKIAESKYSKYYLYLNGHSRMSDSCQNVETIQMSRYEWMDKKNVACIFTREYYSELKNIFIWL